MVDVEPIYIHNRHVMCVTIRRITYLTVIFGSIFLLLRTFDQPPHVQFERIQESLSEPVSESLIESASKCGSINPGSVTSKVIMDSLENSPQVRPELIEEYIESQPEMDWIPPLRFIPQLKNPCWEDIKQNKIRCLPYFYLSGFPKCATTDLWWRIRTLPGIADAPKVKEPHWWTRKRFNQGASKIEKRVLPQKRIIHKSQNMTEYIENFDRINIEQNQISGDGSQSTLWDNYYLVLKSEEHKVFSKELKQAIAKHELQTASLIHAYTPQAKFIVMVRDPVERLYSHYLYFTGQLSGRRYDNVTVSQQDFHTKIVQAIDAIEECFKATNQDIRQCAYDFHIKHNIRTGTDKIRIQIGLYAIYIHSLLRIFPRDQVLVLKLDDYANDRKRVINNICEFLTIKCDDKSLNATDDLDKALQRPLQHKIGDMWKETRLKLTNFYKPFNQVLAKILNDKEFLFGVEEDECS